MCWLYVRCIHGCVYLPGFGCTISLCSCIITLGPSCRAMNVCAAAPASASCSCVAHPAGSTTSHAWHYQQAIEALLLVRQPSSTHPSAAADHASQCVFATPPQQHTCKEHDVARVQPVPHSRHQLRHHEGHEGGLATRRCQALIHIPARRERGDQGREPVPAAET